MLKHILLFPQTDSCSYQLNKYRFLTGAVKDAHTSLFRTVPQAGSELRGRGSAGRGL